MPELHRPALICDIAKHGAELAAFDLVEELTAELEIIPLLINAPAAVAQDVNSLVDIGDKVVERTGRWIGLERDVRHALDRKGGGHGSIGATIRSRATDKACLANGHLIVSEYALFDDRKLAPAARTPSSSKPIVASPPSCERSAITVMRVVPNCSLSSFSGVTNDVPAKLASHPSARSSSVECPTVSCKVSQRLVGSITRSYLPGATGLAFSFSLACRKCGLSIRSQASTYSQPDPRGAARLTLEANAPDCLSMAVTSNWGWHRTRVCAMWLPCDEAKPQLPSDDELSQLSADPELAFVQFENSQGTN